MKKHIFVIMFSISCVGSLANAEDNGAFSQPQRANICDDPRMMRVTLRGEEEETIIRTAGDLPAVTAFICADASNNQTEGGKGIVHLRFSSSAPPSTNTPEIGSLEANTCMLVRTKDRVYANITTDFGGGVCLTYLQE